MKSIFHISRLIISYILILFTLSACTERKAMVFLDKADAILDLHPDSSLYIISEIDSSVLITRNQIATYRLLKDAALFKTGMDLPDDSLSRFARSFFIKRSLYSRKKMLACFLEAHHYLNSGNDSSAINYFNKVIETGQKIKDKNYPGIAMSSIGKIYSDRGLTSNANTYYKNALDFFINNGAMPKYIASTHTDLALSLAATNNLNDAFNHINFGLKIIETDSLSYLSGDLYEARATLHYYSKNYENACSDFEKSRSYGQDLSYRSLSFWTVASMIGKKEYARNLYADVACIPISSPWEQLEKYVMERDVAAINNDLLTKSLYADSIAYLTDEINDFRNHTILTSNSKETISGRLYSIFTDNQFFTVILIIIVIAIFGVGISLSRKDQSKRNNTNVLKKKSGTLDKKINKPITTKSNNANINNTESKTPDYTSMPDMEAIKTLHEKYYKAIEGILAYSKDETDPTKLNELKKIQRKVGTKKFLKEMKCDVNLLREGISDCIVEDLRPDEKELRLLLFSLCGYSYKTIALLTDEVPGTVSSRLSRLKSKILRDGIRHREIYHRHFKYQ